MVLPTPGLPKISMFFPEKIKSSISFTEPKTALPILQVNPTGSPCLFFITEILCKVLSIPALLSSPNLPILLIMLTICSLVTSFLLKGIVLSIYTMVELK